MDAREKNPEKGGCQGFVALGFTILAVYWWVLGQ
jgi:hypothetical protein